MCKQISGYMENASVCRPLVSFFHFLKKKHYEAYALKLKNVFCIM